MRLQTFKSLAQVPAETMGIVPQNTQYNTITQLRPSDFLKSTLNILLGSAGIISFVFLLWGGIQWITSGGDKEAIEKARRKILYALTGLAIIFSAYTVLFALRTWFNINLIEVEVRQLGTYGSGGGGSSPPTLPPGITPTIAAGYCGCGGPPGQCAAAGDQGALVFGGNCWLCQSSGLWVEQLGTAPCAILTCNPCP